VATFCWQKDADQPQTKTEDASSDFPSHHAPATTATTASAPPPMESFHNPALAAIRASQQLQELAARGDLNGVQDGGIQASIESLRELAAEQSRTFIKQEQLSPPTNGSAPSTPELSWPQHSSSSNIDAINQLKRRISEVSDPETQPARHVHLEQSSLYSHSTTTVPVITETSETTLFASPAPPKRRPDPNSDTIGSDLDDSDDEADINGDDEEGDDNMALILCLYDKVSRTKNKWRANMSHGIVCIDGREWVFEKANGEYEW